MDSALPLSTQACYFSGYPEPLFWGRGTFWLWFLPVLWWSRINVFLTSLAKDGYCLQRCRQGRFGRSFVFVLGAVPRHNTPFLMKVLHSFEKILYLTLLFFQFLVESHQLCFSMRCSIRNFTDWAFWITFANIFCSGLVVSSLKKSISDSSFFIVMS